jgi:thymidine phosphorylase
MREPLGRAVGNALEVREAVETLHGRGPADLWALTLELGSHQLLMAGLARDAGEARALLTRLRDEGHGAAKLAELIEAQHGDPRVVNDLSLLPAAPVVVTVEARDPEPRWVSEADARAIGDAALVLGAGRRKKGDPIDPAVGIVVHARIGDQVERGQPLAEIHARTQADAERAVLALREAYVLSPEPVPAAGNGYEVIGGEAGGTTS